MFWAYGLSLSVLNTLGLVVSYRIAMPKVLDLNPAQGTEKLLILAIIFDFFQVFKKQKLSNKLFWPETHLDFINMGQKCFLLDFKSLL